MTRRKKPDLPRTLVQFHYIKGNHFRTVHASGAIGSLTPSGDIHCAFYNERPAIPRITEHELDKDGRLIDEPVAVEGRSGFVRELEMDLIVDVQTARNLRAWLDQKITESEALIKKKSSAARKKRVLI